MSIRSWNLCIFIFLWGTNNGVSARVKMQTCYAQLMTVVAVLWVMFIVVDVCLPIKRPLYWFVFSFSQSARNKMLNIQRSMVVRITIWHVKDFAHNQHNTISLGQNTKTIKYYCAILLSMLVYVLTQYFMFISSVLIQRCQVFGYVWCHCSSVSFRSFDKKKNCVPHAYMKSFYFCNEYLMNFLLFGNIL